MNGEMNMKKLALILTAAALAFSLCACEKTTAEEESTEEQHSIQTEVTETTTSETITGSLYAVLEDGTTLGPQEFSCSGGTVTPERIAAGLTGWTGINFSITSEIDEKNKAITINWKESSAMTTGIIPEEQNEQFTFTDVATMRVFMIESLCESIQYNMGDYAITFTVNGEDIGSLGLSGISSATVY